MKSADEYLKALGYTEHGYRHGNLTGNIARNVLLQLGKSERLAELAAIAGFLHDIGNMVNRDDHGHSGALISFYILNEMGMDPEEIGLITGAIGNHEEENGVALNDISAAVALADKSDVHRSRVRNIDPSTFDIHDRVNYAVERSFLRVDSERKTITLELTIDTAISQVMEYFEIFLLRMIFCRRAAEILGCKFKLVINEIELL